jgi:hypothetical protein
MKFLQRESENLIRQFVLYCKKLEKQLRQEQGEEKFRYERIIADIQLQIDKLRAEKEFKIQSEESAAVIKLQKDIKAWELRFNFLAERLYLSDLENRALMIEIGTRQDVIDGWSDRQDRVVRSKKELEIEMKSLQVQISEYKVKIELFQTEISKQQVQIDSLLKIEKYHLEKCPIELQDQK